MPSDPTPLAPRRRASPLIEWRGKTVVRHAGFVLGKITCPDGHVVSGETLMLEDGVVQCRAQHGTGVHKAHCGALLYVLVLPARGERRRRYWVADVTHAEIKEMERLGLDADGVLSYFGVAFTRERSA